MTTPIQLTFPNGWVAAAAVVHRPADLRQAVRILGLDRARRTMALVGGAAGMRDADLIRLRPLFVDALVPLAERLHACVVDGGTDSGVMRLMGQGRVDRHGTFPLVGVAAAGTVVLPDAAGADGGPWTAASGAGRLASDAAPLEPHHTHFVLVPGDAWGDESPWIAHVAGALADRMPSVTVLVNGGTIARQDVAQSIRAGRPVVIVAGTGGTADALAAELPEASRGAPGDEGALFYLVDPADGAALTRTIERIFRAEE